MLPFKSLSMNITRLNLQLKLSVVVIALMYVVYFISTHHNDYWMKAQQCLLSHL